MGYYINARIARIDDLLAAGIRHCPLQQGFGITTDKCESLLPTQNISIVEADYFGGCGWQTATWRIDGIWYRASTEDDGWHTGRSPISCSLAALGVVPTDSDEFDALGLGDERNNNWLPSMDIND